METLPTATRRSFLADEGRISRAERPAYPAIKLQQGAEIMWPKFFCWRPGNSRPTSPKIDKVCCASQRQVPRKHSLLRGNRHGGCCDVERSRCGLAGLLVGARPLHRRRLRCRRGRRGRHSALLLSPIWSAWVLRTRLPERLERLYLGARLLLSCARSAKARGQTKSPALLFVLFTEDSLFCSPKNRCFVHRSSVRKNQREKIGADQRASS
jgi:hypothetical protein